MYTFFCAKLSKSRLCKKLQQPLMNFSHFCSSFLRILQQFKSFLKQPFSGDKYCASLGCDANRPHREEGPVHLEAKPSDGIAMAFHEPYVGYRVQNFSTPIVLLLSLSHSIRGEVKSTFLFFIDLC